MSQSDKDETKSKKSPLAQSEERVLAQWIKNGIFNKTLSRVAPKGDFVFYEGPPTANGRPGIHHLEARAFKDLIPRYKTMQGYRVRRKAGWDTHGLPVELEVEKKLGLKSKKEIEEYGISKFNEECKKSVWTYVDEWKDFTNRIGYWVDLDHPYVTYEPKYIESLWSIVHKVFQDGYLYKDYKVVPWCPRCGTALSSHELAQGYEDVKDLSVYAKFKVVGKDNTYILAWTTTPWTLPGNVALAVGNDITYVEVEVIEENGIKETYILAKEKISLFDGKGEVVREYVGSEIVGLEYEPLYPFLKDNLPVSEQEKITNGWKVYPADFVTTEDGTGVVHTAVMYGQDDFVLGTKLGLPKFHLVDDTGHFISVVTQFAGRFVKDEDVAIDIIKDLAHRGLLFKKEKYEHSYPFCWRCKTPLIYYARDSWYIRMSALRDELIKENSNIHWQPEHIQKGRFGEWLSDVKDWAISRERYWGTPLPVWIGKEGKPTVIGSIEELQKKTKSNNNHFVFIRHGESEHNVKNVVSAHVEDVYHLTEKGKADVRSLAQDLKNKPGVIYSSPFVRTKETAELLAESLDYDVNAIQYDSRIREYNFGDFHGKDFNEYLSYKKSHMHSYDVPITGGESYADAKKRIGEFLYDIDSKHQNETIYVITHGIALETVSAIIVGADMVESKEIIDSVSFEPGSVLSFNFVPLPHNELFELDLHRPYIDEVVLLDDEENEMRRVKEVMDVWFDSGGMPFAQDHYPFEHKNEIDTDQFPADYISEAIDQTRGWFYTLHAVGVLMGKGRAYKNVICLGHILDKDGQKMSKSRGNAISPWDVIDTYGVDPLRFWMYTVNQPGESKNFDVRTVDDVVKKVFNLFGNVVQFYLLNQEAAQTSSKLESDSEHPLDLWVIARLEETIASVTKSLDEYKPLEGGRALRDFIADVSQWYVRRSRDRMKLSNEDTAQALHTLRLVIMQTVKLLAPFTPFFADDIYHKIHGEKESVHLEDWSEQGAIHEEILRDMEIVRKIVSEALELRARSGIKIRQPLARLTIKSTVLSEKKELLAIIADEVNVKEVTCDEELKESLDLDVVITNELKEEGIARDVIRSIQEERKNSNLIASQKISVTITAPEVVMSAITLHEKNISSVCNVEEFIKFISEEDSETKISIELM